MKNLYATPVKSCVELNILYYTVESRKFESSGLEILF